MLLVVGGILLYANRLAATEKLVGTTTGFDRFFLYTVLWVIVTGVLTETFRFVAVPTVLAAVVYVLHLGIVLTLFLTFPYSKIRAPRVPDAGDGPRAHGRFENDLTTETVPFKGG